MTEEQFNRYEFISKEIKPIKDFLFWCGNKYAHWAGSQYDFGIVCAFQRFALRMKRRSSSDKENTYDIPWELQDRIIDVIEQYVDEKQKELEEI